MVASTPRHASKAPGPAVHGATPRQTGRLIKATWLNLLNTKPALGPDTFVRKGFFPRTLGSLPSHAREPAFRDGETALTGRGCKAPGRSPWKPAGARALRAEPRGCGSAELRVRGPGHLRGESAGDPTPGRRFQPASPSLSRSPNAPFKARANRFGGFLP